MPTTITHSLFTEHVYKRLSEDTKLSMGHDSDIMVSYAQGPDVLFKIGPKYNGQNLGDAMHEKGTGEYFINNIKLIKDLNSTAETRYDLIANKQLVANLYGMVCHAVLDIIVHPYIFYWTGKFDKNNLETYKYKNLHHVMESQIDRHMSLEYTGIPAEKLNVSERYFQVEKIKEVNSKLDKLFSLTYGINAGDAYLRGLRFFSLAQRIARQDPYGTRAAIMRHFNYYHFSYFTGLDKDVLNIQHKPWLNPLTGDINNCSYFELYENAVNEAVCLIEDIVHTSITGEIQEDKIMSELGRSYLTGHKYSEGEQMTHFAPNKELKKAI